MQISSGRDGHCLTEKHARWTLLEQNVFNIILKSFDDNKVLKKLSIRYANAFECTGP